MSEYHWYSPSPPRPEPAPGSDFHRAWQEEVGLRSGGGRPDQRPVPMYVDRCIFWNGKHVDGPPNCPHTQTVDEMGEVLPPGWTVQNNGRQ